jgi:hypothetical protein
VRFVGCVAAFELAFELFDAVLDARALEVPPTLAFALFDALAARSRALGRYGGAQRAPRLFSVVPVWRDTGTRRWFTRETRCVLCVAVPVVVPRWPGAERRAWYPIALSLGFRLEARRTPAISAGWGRWCGQVVDALHHERSRCLAPRAPKCGQSEEKHSGNAHGHPRVYVRQVRCLPVQSWPRLTFKSAGIPLHLSKCLALELLAGLVFRVWVGG